MQTLKVQPEFKRKPNLSPDIQSEHIFETEKLSFYLAFYLALT